MLTGFLEINDPAGIIDNIRIFAPSITHLCIPAYVLPLHLLSPMLPILQKGMDRVIEPSGNATFPSTLWMLLLHDSGIAYSEPNLSARLSKSQEDCRIVFVDRKWGGLSSKSTGPQWESGWIDGINGGEGFWSKGYMARGADHFSGRNRVEIS